MARTRTASGQRDLIDYAEGCHQDIEAALRDDLTARAIEKAVTDELIVQLRAALMRAHGLLEEMKRYAPQVRRQACAAFVLASRELLGR